MINTQYKNIVPFKNSNKYFIKGEKNFLVFLTSNSSTVYPGLNEVGYFYNETENNLKICFSIISKKEDIVDYELLKEEGKCTTIDEINDIKFNYLISENEFRDDIDGIFPIEINLEFKLSGIEKEINVQTIF
jgi:hypothetical protein